MKECFKAILLPGMDGTGELFSDFAKALAGTLETNVVQYPNNKILFYSELVSIVQTSTPASQPFVIIAESFSTPLAVQVAATKPSNLKALIICAGFITNPVQKIPRFICAFLAWILFHIPLPKFAIRYLLIGPKAPDSLLSAVREAISSVEPKVLSARIRAILACDARAELSQVDVPIIYIKAKQDRLVPNSCLDEILQIKPQTVVMVVDGPHLLFQRQPQRTAEVIIKFIQQSS